jgi:hypothetical protein
VELCTIIAKNYVAQARVLARSFTEHHPDDRLWVLIIDDFEGFIEPSEEPFEVLTPAGIGCDEFEEMAARYSILELSTAVKPWLLRHLMDRSEAPVTYLDPDIRVYGSLTQLDQLAARHGVVLTPHNTEPLPADGLRPGQVDIMIAGIYNLGYVSLAPRPEVDRLLEWWAERLRRDCRVDPVWGYFVDQRWFDLAPGFLSDLAIVRDPQYNAAYWNMHSRRVEHDGERYLVNGIPLAFFHFSGFDPLNPTELSLHQNRVDLATQPVLAGLCREYAEETVRDGLVAAREWPYTYGTLPGGVTFDDVLRRLFVVAEERGEVRGSPFTAETARSYVEWLTAQEPDAPSGIHRLLAHVYGTRPDVRTRFPDLSGPGLAELLRWSQAEGKDMVAALGELPLPTGSAPAPLPPAAPGPPRQRWGVNVVADFGPELGERALVSRVLAALDTRAIAALPLGNAKVPADRWGSAATYLDYGDAEYPVNLICVPPGALRPFTEGAGQAFFAGRYSIGLWASEETRAPDGWLEAVQQLDELWIPSAYAQEAIASTSTAPVVKMPVPVEMPPIVPRARAELGAPEGFLFLSGCDYEESFARTNPLAVIETFADTFAPGEGANLVITCKHADADPISHELLLAAASAHPDVTVLEGPSSEQGDDTLLALCDCYVSLHRATAFGYALARAMFCAKPVIATGYSGNLEFMTPENSLLVRHRMVAAGMPDADVLADDQWAEPDAEHAAALMRSVYEDRELGKELGARAAQDIHTTRSPAMVGRWMERRLAQIRETQGAWRDRPGGAPGPLVVSELGSRVRQGPLAPGSGRGKLRRTFRRSVLRLMRPLSAYQQSVNAEMVRSLEAVGAELERMRARLVRSDVAGLEAGRRLAATQRFAPVVEAQARAIDAHGTQLEESHGAGRFETDREIYLAVSELRRAHEGVGDGARDQQNRGELTPWELKAFSQNGEDGVLAEILGRIGAPARYFVEFGIESGREGNCVFLADVMAWSGLFLESDARLFGELARKYEPAGRIKTLQAMVTPENVEELFARAGVPRDLDVLSIDVDGADYWIWEAIAEYQPRVVVIEYNSALDPSRRLVQPRGHGGWDGTDYFGASLGAIRTLGDEKGYRLVHTELTGNNAFLVSAELADGRFPPPEEVPVRGLPNYFQSGYNHPRDEQRRRYFDLDTGELVEAARSPAPEASGTRA